MRTRPALSLLYECRWLFAARQREGATGEIKNFTRLRLNDNVLNEVLPCKDGCSSRTSVGRRRRVKYLGMAMLALASDLSHHQFRSFREHSYV